MTGVSGASTLFLFLGGSGLACETHGQMCIQLHLTLALYKIVYERTNILFILSLLFEQREKNIFDIFEVFSTMQVAANLQIQ